MLLGGGVAILLMVRVWCDWVVVLVVQWWYGGVLRTNRINQNSILRAGPSWLTTKMPESEKRKMPRFLF